VQIVGMIARPRSKRPAQVGGSLLKMSLGAIRGERTLAQLAAKHSIHQTMINAWKKQAIEGMSGVFSGEAEAIEAAGEGYRNGRVMETRTKLS